MQRGIAKFHNSTHNKIQETRYNENQRLSPYEDSLYFKCVPLQRINHAGFFVYFSGVFFVFFNFS